MLKRIFDFIFSSIGLIVFLPLLIIISLFIFIGDFRSPLYFGKRVGKNNRHFFLIKFRSMVKSAEELGGDSTANDDVRITKIGHFIRAFKIDEIPQLINVIVGNMSLVGPRPQTISGVALYNKAEKNLLKIRPGITDFSSIVFSDEGEILDGAIDPDLAYNQIIRPWKSRLSLLYQDNISLWLDIKIILLTLLAIFSKNTSLIILTKILKDMNVDKKLIRVASRKYKLTPHHLPR